MSDPENYYSAPRPDDARRLRADLEFSRFVAAAHRAVDVCFEEPVLTQETTRQKSFTPPAQEGEALMALLLHIWFYTALALTLAAIWPALLAARDDDHHNSPKP